MSEWVDQEARARFANAMFGAWWMANDMADPRRFSSAEEATLANRFRP